MNTLPTNPAELVSQMIADHLQCESLTVSEMEDLVMLLRRCVLDGAYHTLGVLCAKALLAQLRGQVIALKHIEIARVK